MIEDRIGVVELDFVEPAAARDEADVGAFGAHTEAADTFDPGIEVTTFDPRFQGIGNGFGIRTTTRYRAGTNPDIDADNDDGGFVRCRDVLARNNFHGCRKRVRASNE